jgi:hypothetical protein
MLGYGIKLAYDLILNYWIESNAN